MYSYERRKTAVGFFALYHSYASVIRELGYPSRCMLQTWIREFEKK